MYATQMKTGIAVMTALLALSNPAWAEHEREFGRNGSQDFARVHQ